MSDSERVDAAYSLAADAASIEVARELSRLGIRSILLKGAVLSDWLYGERDRRYSDADLLVADADFGRATKALARLGFELVPGQLPPTGEPVHAEPWLRADGASVDLHRTLFGLSVSPARAWAELSPLTAPLRIGPATLEQPTVPVRALVVGLHAAQHGARASKPLEDLRRALQRASFEDWREAAELAERLGATVTFAAGLGLTPEGRRLASRLGLPDPDVAAAAIHGGEGLLLVGIDRVAKARGLVAKAGVIASELFPSPDYMRWAARGAANTRGGLARAYAARLVGLLRQAVPSLRAWRRAYRDSPPEARTPRAESASRGPSSPRR
jgi:Uncharacterised nucleotidyltransferase